MNHDAESADTEFTLGGHMAFYGGGIIDAEASAFSARFESAAARGLIGHVQERRRESPTTPS